MLKEVDVEDLKTLSQNNSQVTRSIKNLLFKWDKLRDEEIQEQEGG